MKTRSCNTAVSLRRPYPFLKYACGQPAGLPARHSLRIFLLCAGSGYAGSDIAWGLCCWPRTRPDRKRHWWYHSVDAGDGPNLQRRSQPHIVRVGTGSLASPACPTHTVTTSVFNAFMIAGSIPAMRGFLGTIGAPLATKCGASVRRALRRAGPSAVHLMGQACASCYNSKRPPRAALTAAISPQLRKQVRSIMVLFADHLHSQPILW